MGVGLAFVDVTCSSGEVSFRLMGLGMGSSLFVSCRSKLSLCCLRKRDTCFQHNRDS